MTSMSQRSAPTRTIKRRPKLDAQAISLIVHYIVQIEKTTPEKGITWTELAARFNYSRQALEKHEPIKTAYRTTNDAVERHRKKASLPAEEQTPQSWTEMQRLLTKLRGRLQEKEEINKRLLRFIVDLSQKSHEKGVSIADIPLDLPTEYRNPIFSMDEPLQEKHA